MGDPILEDHGLTHAGIDVLAGEVCFGLEDQNDVPCAQAGESQNEPVDEALAGVPDSRDLENGFVE